jgi:hypothetical protein
VEAEMLAEMTFTERHTWIFGVTTLVSYVAYLAVMLGRAQGTPLAEVAYVRPMLWSIGGVIVTTIAGGILAGVRLGRDCGQKDDRDREIHRFGEYVGTSFLVLGGAAALFLSMFEVAHFWIANAVYLCFALSALLGSVTKIIAYRGGFQSC